MRTEHQDREIRSTIPHTDPGDHKPNGQTPVSKPIQPNFSQPNVSLGRPIGSTDRKHSPTTIKSRTLQKPVPLGRSPVNRKQNAARLREDILTTLRCAPIQETTRNVRASTFRNSRTKREIQHRHATSRKLATHTARPCARGVHPRPPQSRVRCFAGANATIAQPLHEHDIQPTAAEQPSHQERHKKRSDSLAKELAWTALLAILRGTELPIIGTDFAELQRRCADLSHILWQGSKSKQWYCPRQHGRKHHRNGEYSERFHLQ
mmetsp:Transcript_12757/g.30530  ORF Transcript_12757/g.30530 Transcript_12757/m.30530 type:complete len:263 (-) Transcript_12757:139-927(-)